MYWILFSMGQFWLRGTRVADNCLHTAGRVPTVMENPGKTLIESNTNVMEKGQK